ncbi:alpha/beta fold hydrolase [Allofranklinella schreckenbergeri]|uniref:Alpha/beta fold hydrolase n=1 Tax=Allofranklinella schreckenbergeri TaxID=1076744 RepID=A0A3M6QHX8_9BURK|nr:alpha/beta hydrolase [Allofranklinella schreckenbergeri]RMX02668.1 alpha/beta fold hydrolase [Allofranklinella schreckenbergeri]RRD41575.1 alpha/beta fold hydrolase [Comamonadaceae bacterium OH3737_COT-264]
MPHDVYDAARNRYLDVGDARLFVTEAGAPDGEPVLLLHGGLGDVYDFKSIVTGLPQHLRLIALELRGQGRSSRGTAPLSYAQYQADVLAVLDHMQIASARLLGFSDGGIIGYRLAAQNPQRVRALATIGSQWRLLPDDPCIPIFQGLTRQQWQSLFPSAVARYEAGNPQPDFDALLEEVKALWLDADPATGYPGDMVEHIAAPTLLICGDRDPFMPVSEVQALRERITGANAGVFILPFADHAAHAQARAVFLPAVNAFLSAPDAPALR